MKLNSEYLLEVAIYELNAIWRLQYFFEYCLNPTVCKFSNFYIDTVNAVQKKFVKLHEMGEQIKSLLLLRLLQ